MFYAHFVLAKKGPLARIWLAAHWDKKLTKAHVFETNIEKSVDGILQPKVKMALRTSGHLLLGVVRIYSRKAKYLLADCNEAFVKIKMAFRPGMVDLPEEHREAAVTAITLPEVFHDFDTAMPELKDVDIEAQFSLNQSRAEEITMREDYGSLSLVTHDQGFGDMSFDAEPPELLRHGSGMEPSLDQSHMLFSDGPGIETALEQKEKEPVAGTSATTQPMDIDTPIRDDGFGGHLGQDIISGGLFEGGLFDEAPMGEVPVPEVSSINEQQEAGAAPGAAASVHDESDEDMGDHFGGPASPMGGMSSDSSRPATPAAAGEEIEGRISVASRRFTPAPPVIPEEHANDNVEEPPPLQDQTTLLHDEEESFALAPIDASALKGFTKAKRKRKLIVDEVKNISGEEMKAQLSDTSDIITTLDLAPPTKRLMHWKETGGVEKLFALPGRPIPARVLFKNYQRHLTSKSYDHEDFGRLGTEEDGMSLEQIRDAPEEVSSFEQSILNKRTGRKRKAPQDDEIRPPPQPAQPTSAEFQSNEAEIPNIIAQHNLSSESSMPPEISLPAEPSDISSIVPSGELSEVPPTTEAPLLGSEIPQIAPAEVNSILGTHEEPQVPSAQEEAATVQTSDMPQMENMGYDQAQPHVSYMGYDEQHPPAHTPGAISERGPATPWNHEDYEFPPSVGPQEEQQMDETYEQFEERVLNKRAAHMYHVIKSKLDTKDKLTLSEMAYKNNRKQVAQKFYTLLVLKKFQVLELNQEYSYAEIIVTKGPKFENPAL
ncbi:PREDICTED: double-strand-break repair protein rad21 homolog [Wasmannia auropunctata]|uniref:double-strand-break repair protein rad21 homolog n=1 Tax=Wasmannia auropunctata TaxID=64793 RepID=UPI0005EEA959|nr:PREDICTED: double-strand-break repair protein rad21 homolog [Wasmannia auropunctata]XP_011685230.1 PREDICTED: double-strand-break repair protein rad21 homolog [Wasmannia auropunctata]XP_011685231.1 PREDICTED: double-strand-break repair protein rad21 homolog [Wasmannia auropunctata]